MRQILRFFVNAKREWAHGKNMDVLPKELHPSFPLDLLVVHLLLAHHTVVGCGQEI